MVIHLDLSHSMCNVMLIPQYFKQAMILNDRIIDEEILEKLLLQNTVDQADEILAKPKIVSNVSKIYNELQVQKLSDLYCGYGTTSKNNHQNAYSRVNVFIMGVLPCDPFEFTQLFCASCAKTFSFRDVQASVVAGGKKEVYNCPECEQISKPIYRMIFLVKDESTLGLDKIYKMHFYSYNCQTEDFFCGIKPTNLYKDTSSLAKIKEYMRLLSRFNVYIDIIIRRKYSQKINEDLFELFDGKLIELPQK